MARYQRLKQEALETMINKYETAVFLTDEHIPYVSESVVSIVEQYLKDAKPKYRVHGGDLFDNPGMSTFEKDPNHRMDSQEEIDRAVQYLNRLHVASPKTRTIILPGNHDVGRLERLKSIQGMALKNLRALDYKQLILESSKTQGLPIGEVEFKDRWTLGPGMLFVHGDPRMTPEIVSGVNGPKRTADTHPFDGHVMYGHSHQCQSVSSKWGSRRVFMVPALMDLSHKGYVHQSEYQNGFAVIHYAPQVRPRPIYHVQNVVVEANGSVIVDGKEYRGK